MYRRKKTISFLLALVIAITSFIFVFDSDSKVVAATNTPLSVHGKLSVNGADIVDKNGNKFQLRGLSTHGLAWDGNPYSDVGGTYVSEASFRTLRDDWGANAIRLALYVDEYDGYCNGGNRTTLNSKIATGVNTARDLGMYVIIDWHVLNANPNNYLEDAKTFWNDTSAKYKDYDNVLYEICNEPNNCSWDDIKNYANVIIPIIRANDPDAIIIVGTPTFSQLGQWGHTNEVADSPLTGYSNIMYTLHFYCAEQVHSQYLPNKVKYARDRGIPVFVTEFGLSEASGNGNISTSSADSWLQLLDSYNISYFCWSLSKKNESSALFKTSATSNWSESDLTPAGIYIRNSYRARKETYADVPTTPVTQAPTSTPVTNTPTNKPVNNPTNKPVAKPTSRPTNKPVANPVIEKSDKKYAEEFIERLYVNMLGRKSDKEGMKTWVNLLASDAMNGDMVADGFYYSPEFTKISKSLSNRDYVKRMYITILGRKPDEAGLNMWTGKLDNGSMTREQVYKGFLGSQEWHDMCAKNDIISGHYQISRFVDRLYLVILERKPDATGKAMWVTSISNGTPAYDVAYGFVFSPEFTNKGISNQEFVKILYNTVLDRDPDSTGLNTWVNILNNGGSRLSVFEGIVKSQEFGDLCASYGMNAF